MFCFKFQQNLLITAEFDYFEGEEGGGERPSWGKGAPIHKFLSQLLLVNKLKYYVSNFIKIAQ